jgi:hypothetical protein
MSAAATIARYFEDVDYHDEVTGITIKGRRIEESSLNLASGIHMAYDEEFLYITYNIDSKGILSTKREKLKVSLDKIKWNEIYISEEDKKDKQNFMTAAAYFGTGNAMQSYDYSYLYVRLPFLNPDTSKEEFIEFKLKNEKRMKRIQRFLGKNKARITNKNTDAREQTPLEILKERFAKGEIDEEEFQRKKSLLQEGNDEIETCPGCGENVDEDLNYCTNCGEKL